MMIKEIQNFLNKKLNEETTWVQEYTIGANLLKFKTMPKELTNITSMSILTMGRKKKRITAYSIKREHTRYMHDKHYTTNSRQFSSIWTRALF